MTRILVLVSLLAVSMPFASASEWKPLFNGTDLSGWVVKCLPQDQAKTFWTVDDGAIRADSLGKKGHDYIWLMTENEYSDFHLRLKFQAFRDSPGNSGAQIRSRYDDSEGWLNGPQVDINPPGPWRTGMMWDETRGNQRWIYPDLPRKLWVDESMSPAGLKMRFHDEEPGWNEMEIIAKGTSVTAALNGIQITDFDGAGIIDDATHQALNVGMKGHIALQIHAGDQLKIRFKDIELKELNRNLSAFDWIQKSKPIAQEFKKALQSELRHALLSSGFAQSIQVCKTASATMEDAAAAKHDELIRVRRVSLKTRNPLRHTPSPTEKEWLEKNEAVVKGNVNPLPGVLFEEGKTTVLFPILIDEPVCLMCHGDGSMISDDVKAALAKEYPDDSARGYQSGDLRGALTLEWKP